MKKEVMIAVLSSLIVSSVTYVVATTTDIISGVADVTVEQYKEQFMKELVSKINISHESNRCDNDVTCRAVCPVNTILISGGCDTDGPSIIDDSFPSKNDNSWVCHYNEQVNKVRVFSVCAGLEIQKVDKST